MSRCYPCMQGRHCGYCIGCCFVDRGTESLSWISSCSTGPSCVEVANLPDGDIGIRDSKDQQGAILRFTPGEFRAFLGGVRNGEFDHFGEVK